MTAKLSALDYIGTIRARIGALRNSYKVTPGLYCIGTPDSSSPVLITGNYKLTFDSLRKELEDQSLWILVIDSRGINVWCAAGKGTFSTDEIVYQVKKAQLDDIVSHREIIIPQFGATGVAAHKLKKQCGFKGVFGPILASDLPAYLQNRISTEKMKTVTFSIAERAILIPVEICLFWKTFGLIILTIFGLSFISPDITALPLVFHRALMATTYTAIGVFSGAALTPLLLPWIPFRQFWLKGLALGSIVAFIILAITPANSFIFNFSIFLWISSLSSFLAMNFTGSTPFTSLTGVATEMKAGVPVQLIMAILAVFLWIVSAFV